jgi:hypothetical protein
MTNQLTSKVFVTISASAYGSHTQGAFVVTAITPSSLSFLPNTVAGGGNTVGTVSFPAPLNQDTVVSLSVLSGAAAVSSIPASVTVSAGSSSANFTVGTNSVSGTTIVKVSAAANGGSRSASFTVR